jgi:hypothetical protein
MSLDAFLDRLEGKRTGADRGIARCPGHEDRRASLSVRELDDGRVLIHCFAGCSVEEILAGAGLTFDALFPERAIDHKVKGERKPFRAGALVRALGHELLIALIVLSDVAEGRSIDDANRARAAEARGRIMKFLGELRHAA